MLVANLRESAQRIMRSQCYCVKDRTEQLFSFKVQIEQNIMPNATTVPRWGKTVFIFFILKYTILMQKSIFAHYFIKWICMLNNLKYQFIKLTIIEPLFFFTYRTIDLSISEQAS